MRTLTDEQLSTFVHMSLSGSCNIPLSVGKGDLVNKKMRKDRNITTIWIEMGRSSHTKGFYKVWSHMISQDGDVLTLVLFSNYRR